MAQLRHCEVCQTDVGFPNVRLANRAEERSRLAARVRDARAVSAADQFKPELRALRQIARDSQVVFNRRLGHLHTWITGDSPLYLTYHQQVAAGRTPQENRWDRQRRVAEGTVNPNFSDHLSVGALSADGRGLTYYGAYAVTLREPFIAARATCFEENPFYFCEHMEIMAGQDAPAGYRATWRSRASLVAAKLAPKMRSGLTDAELTGLMMEPRGSAADCDFVEVHIYGPIHRASIARVSGPAPDDEMDALLWRQVKEALTGSGVAVEETA